MNEYENMGWNKGTFKVELELPVEFKRDFTEKGMFDNKNKMSECFDRILSAIRCKDITSLATYEREICEVMKIAMGNAKVEMRDDMAKEDNESVEKEEKTGHWMHWIYSSDYVNDTAYKCSECGFEQSKSEKLSRCPKCKSKMQEYGD